jgi:hypothetical protein
MAKIPSSSAEWQPQQSQTQIQSSSIQSAKTAISSSSPTTIQWDIRTLHEPALVLNQLGLAEHIGLFREQEIDMQAFLLLDEQCLGTLGVNTLGARRKIMHAVNSQFFGVLLRDWGLI